MKKLQASHIKKASKAQVKSLRKIFHQNRKKGHKLIFARDAPCQHLERVKDIGTNKLHSEGFGMRQRYTGILVTSCKLLKAPPPPPPPGASLPWEVRGKHQLDPLDLQTGNHGAAACQDDVTCCSKWTMWMSFTNCLDTLQGTRQQALMQCRFKSYRRSLPN